MGRQGIVYSETLAEASEGYQASSEGYQASSEGYQASSEGYQASSEDYQGKAASTYPLHGFDGSLSLPNRRSKFEVRRE